MKVSKPPTDRHVLLGDPPHWEYLPAYDPRMVLWVVAALDIAAGLLLWMLFG
jgi:hypothetical protein